MNQTAALIEINRKINLSVASLNNLERTGEIDRDVLQYGKREMPIYSPKRIAAIIKYVQAKREKPRKYKKRAK